MCGPKATHDIGQSNLNKRTYIVDILRRNWTFELCDVLSLKNYIHIPVYVSIYVGYMTELSMSLGVGEGHHF